MISKILKFGILVLCIGSFTLGNAQDKKKRSPEKTFKKMDADANGSISLEEFKAVRMKDASKEKQITKRFGKMDTNGDGSLDMAEFKVAMDKAKNKDKSKM